MSRMITVVSGVCLLAGAAMGQPDFGTFDPRDEMEEHMERPDQRPPVIILGPPEGFEPPEDMPEMNPENPEEAKRMAVKMFFKFMDHSGDGVLDFDEFTHWIQDFVVPGGMPDEMEHDGRREDDRGRMDDERGHMDDEGGDRGSANPMDMARQKMEDARKRMKEQAKGRMGDDGDHQEHEGDGDHDGEEMGHDDDGDRNDSSNPMDMARRKMDEARDRMRKQAGDRGGDMRDRMEEEGREHMDEMMMDGFHKDMHPDLAELPDAPECSDELRERELKPQREGVSCGDREGNLIFRTVCNMPGFGAAAISLPEGRGASCFGIRALSGKIGFEIVSEAGRPIWNMAMGPESYEHLRLGAGVYHVKATGGDDDAAITISFIDVSPAR